MVEAVGDVVEAVGDVVEAVGDVVEAVDVVTGGGVQMCWGIPSEFPPNRQQCIPLHADCMDVDGVQASSVAGCVRFSPFAIGMGMLSPEPWCNQKQHPECLRTWTCWRWTS